jgi:hypothetical protein
MVKKRSKILDAVGTGDRQARRVVSALIERGALLSAEQPGPAAPCISGSAGVTLDAGIISRLIGWSG